jgi:hypothetical protein
LSKEVFEVRVAVGDDRCLDVLEHLPVDAFWVVGGVQDKRRDDPEEGGLPHPLRSVVCEVADDLPRAHREADKRDLFEPEVLEQRVQIGSEGVVVVAGRGLAGQAEAAPVVIDRAITAASSARS